MVRLRIGQHAPRDLSVGDAIAFVDAQVRLGFPGAVEVDRAL